MKVTPLRVVAHHRLAAGPEPRLDVRAQQIRFAKVAAARPLKHLVHWTRKPQRERRRPHPPDAQHPPTSARTRRGNTPPTPVTRVSYLQRPGNARGRRRRRQMRHSRAAGATPRRGAFRSMSGARCHFFYEKQSPRRTPAQISERGPRRPRFVRTQLLSSASSSVNNQGHRSSWSLYERDRQTGIAHTSSIQVFVDEEQRA